MLKFNDLVEGIKNTEILPEDFFKQFLTAENYRDYEVDYPLDANQNKAIKKMFDSRKDLLKRADSAFRIDPFCLEAFFVYFVLNEDVFVNYRFESYFSQADSYGDLDAYQKHCFIAIMNFYVEFLLDIRNITRAIKIQRLIIRLKKENAGEAIDRLSFMYNLLEDSDEFYRLYLDCDFNEYDYLLLLVTLLKNDEKLLAKEVLFDMFENIEYASYLDHLWDLDMDDPKQKAFYDGVEDCFDDISAIPEFFTWVNLTKENNKVI